MCCHENICKLHQRHSIVGYCLLQTACLSVTIVVEFWGQESTESRFIINQFLKKTLLISLSNESSISGLHFHKQNWSSKKDVNNKKLFHQMVLFQQKPFSKSFIWFLNWFENSNVRRRYDSHWKSNQNKYIFPCWTLSKNLLLILKSQLLRSC